MTLRLISTCCQNVTVVFFDSSRLFSFTMPLASLFIQTIVVSLTGVAISGFYLLWRDIAARNIRRQVRCSHCLCFPFFWQIANSINSQSYLITLIAGEYLAEDTRTKLESGNPCTKYSEGEGSLYGQSPSSPRSRHQMKVFLSQMDTRTRHLIEEWLMA